ncbi:MAG: SAM-dependent methyltransferase [Dehalococcoidia bacterium]|nr:SAM-dependent methyltransferase [Dehalococcoidia bacterium]
MRTRPGRTTLIAVFFRKKKPFDRPAPPAEVALAAIGHVANEVERPRPRGWEKVESRIDVLPGMARRLEGIEAFSHVIVVFYMDLAENAPEKPETLALESGRDYGIFATRSQLRPNHLGVSAVPLLRHEGASISVRGLDAINGTPVLDIKPYLPDYDACPDATIPPG